MISAADAKLQAQGNLVILREVRAIEEAILTAVNSNLLNATVSDGTTMTMSTPAISVTATVNNPTTTASQTFTINSTTVTSSGTTINSIIDDINTLAISGITASKTAVAGALKIASDNNNFTLTLSAGSGTLLGDLGLTAATTTATAVSKVYYNVWQGTATNTTYTQQMAEVIKYFTDKGYTIARQKNTDTTNTTFKWYVTW
jgi:hypothetical protein|tara:strand:+ start:28 stop:633 length:606 start_codon:yes stop_codon:yes gene_type:complete